MYENYLKLFWYILNILNRYYMKKDTNMEKRDSSFEYSDKENQNCCSHIRNSVKVARLNRNIINLNNFNTECEKCKYRISNEGDLSLLMCLNCGEQNCARQHAETHFYNFHTNADSHAICVNTTTWSVWCYLCDDEINLKDCKITNLHLLISEIREKKNFRGDNEKSIAKTNEHAQESEFFARFIEEINKQNLRKTSGPYIYIDNRHVFKHLREGNGKSIAERNDHSKEEVSKAINMGLPRTPRPLMNIGNTCFFNSVMQCLVRTPYLLHLLQQSSQTGKYFRLPDGELVKYKKSSLTIIFSKTLDELLNGPSTIYNPEELFSKFIKKRPQFDGNQQQDSHELLIHLIEAVRKDEMKRYRRAMSSNDTFEVTLPVDQVFRGTLVSILQCQECKHISYTDAFFLDLSLPISKFQIKGENELAEGESKNFKIDRFLDILNNKNVEENCNEKPDRQTGDISIKTCLNEYVAPELLTGINQVGCVECSILHGNNKTVYTNATKQLLVKDAPPVLILHLNRFQNSGLRSSKVNEKVSYTALLDFTPFCYKTSESGQVLYSLYGVVIHSGSMYNGHYIAYVKLRAPLNEQDARWRFLSRNQKAEENINNNNAEANPQVPSGKWYYTSDSHVRQVSEAEALSAQAYLLFYERIL